jgi:hypothetical protein
VNGRTCTRAPAAQSFTCQPASATKARGHGTQPQPGPTMPGGWPGSSAAQSGPAGATFASGGTQITGDPSTALQDATIRPAVAQRIGGQVCNGYTYTAATGAGTTTGTLYVSRTTGWPCEQVAATTAPSPMGDGRSTTRSVTRWSRFDDRTLRVPALTGSN